MFKYLCSNELGYSWVFTVRFIILIYSSTSFSFKNISRNTPKTSQWGHTFLEFSSGNSWMVQSEFLQGCHSTKELARVLGGTEYQEFLYLLFLALSFCVSQVAYCFSLRRLVTSSVLLPREQKIQIFKKQKGNKLHIFIGNWKCAIHFPTFKTEDNRLLRIAYGTVLAHSRYSVHHCQT